MAPANNYETSSSPLFMDELYNAGVIDERVFSMHLTNFMDTGDQDGSKLLIGGYDLS
jgi:hypothetical protein